MNVPIRCPIIEDLIISFGLLLICHLLHLPPNLPDRPSFPITRLHIVRPAFDFVNLDEFVFGRLELAK